MTKNMTRKGLALGAAFALVGSALVAAPAQAAGEVTLEVNTGIGNSTIIQESFTVRAGLAPSVPVANIAQLKYEVTNASKAALTFVTPTSGSQAVSNVNSDASLYVVTPGSTSTTVANTLAFSTAATETSVVSVVAWVDSDLDGVRDSNEFSSAAVTINFVKAADVAWAVDFTSPVVGDTKLKAVVSAGDINLAQLATNPVSVLFTETTTATSGTTPVNTALIGASLVAGTNTLKAEDTFAFDFDGSAVTSAGGEVTSVQASKRYTAQAVYKLGGSETASNTVGTAVAKLSSAASVDSIAAPATTASNNFKVSTGAVAVRESVLTIPVSITTTLATKAAAGVEVTVKVSEPTGTNVKAAAVISAGGKSFTATSASGESIEFQAVTDAEGKVNFNLSATGIAAGNAVEVFAYAQGVNLTGTNKTTYTWTAPVVDKLAVLNVIGTSAQPVAAVDAAYTLDYAALDQFGSLLTGNYRVKATDSTNTRFAAINNGRATVSMPGVKTDVTVVANVQVQDTTTSNWADVAATATATATGDDAVSQGVQVGSFNAAANVTLSGTSTNLSLSLFDYAASNTALGETEASTTLGTTLSGSVTDSTSAVTHSAVTLSAPGLQFRVGSVTALDSITVLTDPTNGQFSGVSVFSNKAGKFTVTATAGAVSKTLDLTFSNAANDSGASLVIDAPAFAAPGATMVVKGTLTDKFGNPVSATNGVASAGSGAGNVKFALTYSGPGLIVGSLPTATDANGSFEFRVLLGSSDTGAAVVTATYDGDDTSATDTATPQIVVSKTVTVGVEPTVDTKVNAGSFKGYVAVYAKGYEGKRLSAKIGNDWVIVPSLASNFERVTDFTGAGVSIAVRIYIDRVLVDTINLVTK
jgi:hypothetical protein